MVTETNAEKCTRYECEKLEVETKERQEEETGKEVEGEEPSSFFPAKTENGSKVDDKLFLER